MDEKKQDIQHTSSHAFPFFTQGQNRKYGIAQYQETAAFDLELRHKQGRYVLIFTQQTSEFLFFLGVTLAYSEVSTYRNLAGTLSQT